MSATSIHPSAVVDSRAQIGEGVTVGPFSVIGPHVTVGDRCTIHSHVVVDGHTTLGVENQIFQFASIGAQPQDLKFGGEDSTLTIGDKNVIREYVTLQPGTEHGRMTTSIGSGNLFMAMSHVAHDCIVGDHNVFANSVALGGHVHIGNNVILGGLVGIHQFTRIGDYSMMSGGSMVGTDVSPYCFAQGDRAKLRGINTVGLQRAGFSEEAIGDIKKTYHLLLAKPGRMEERLNSFPTELAEKPHVKRMVDFLRGSERGVMFGSRSAN